MAFAGHDKQRDRQQNVGRSLGEKAGADKNACCKQQTVASGPKFFSLSPKLGRLLPA